MECANCSTVFHTPAGHANHLDQNPECALGTPQLNAENYEQKQFDRWEKSLMKSFPSQHAKIATK